MKDTIFLDSDPFHPQEAPLLDRSPHRFAFNAKVAAVFDDMISRSIPGYERIQETSAQLTLEALDQPGAVYDLGCSTGTSLLLIAQKIKERRVQDQSFARGCHLIGIDSSADMIKRAEEKIAAFDCAEITSVLQADIRSTELTDARVVLSHYTLQFLPPTVRKQIIKDVQKSLYRDGIFIFSEKVKHDIPSLEHALTTAHEQFRQKNGYSLVEIIRKRQALEHVLVPFTIEQNLNLLREAGFRYCEVISKDLCFVTFLAQK